MQLEVSAAAYLSSRIADQCYSRQGSSQNTIESFITISVNAEDSETSLDDSGDIDIRLLLKQTKATARNRIRQVGAEVVSPVPAF